MNIHQPDVTVLQFDVFHLAPSVDLLYRGDDVVPLEPRAVRALRYLVEHHDRVLSKEELLEEVWSDVYTTDGVLKKAVSLIRRTLGDDAEQSRFIATYHGRGYRFIARVTRSQSAREIAPAVKSSPILAPNYDQLATRDAELATLRAELRSAMEGSPRPVLVAGESGIGKTQLVRHFRRWALEQGAIPLCARFIDYHGARLAPYDVFLELLRTAIGNSRGSGSLRDAVEKSCGVRLPAELFEESGRACGSSVVVPICRASLALTRRQPVVIAFDDLQWADPASLDVLGCLMRMLDGERLMLIMMVRSDDVEHPGHPVRAWLAEQAARRSYATLRLERLDEEDCRRLIGAIFGAQRNGEIPSSDIEALFQLTDGNPYFLVETLRLLVSTEAIVPDSATGQWVWKGARELSLPETIVTAARAKIERLSPAVRFVIDQAAVLGEKFPIATLCRLTALSEPDIEQALSEALRGGVLAAGEECRFQHSILRRVAYDAIPVRRRTVLHARAAEAIEAVHGADDRVAEALAVHYGASGESRRSFDAGVRAWRAARSRAEWRKALALIERVEETSRTLTLTHDEQLDLLLALGETWCAAGKIRQSASVLDRAVSIASAAGGEASLGRALFLRALTESAAGSYVEARASLLQVLDLFLEHGNDVSQALAHLAMVEAAMGNAARASSLAADVVTAFAHGVRGWSLALRGRYAEGAALLQKAVDDYELLGDVRERALLLRRLHMTYLARGEYETAVVVAIRARSDSATAGDVNGQAKANVCIGHARLAQGRHDEAVTFLSRALEQLRATGDAHSEAGCFWLLGRARYETGALEESGPLLTCALAMIRQTGARGDELRILVDLTRLALLRGQIDVAEEHAHAARALADAIEDVEGSALAGLEVARLELARARPASAVRIARHSRAVLETLQSGERARASAIQERIESEAERITLPVAAQSV